MSLFGGIAMKSLVVKREASFVTVAVMLGVFFCSAALRADLVVNGSFEQSRLTPNSTFTNGLFTQTDNGDVTGWTSQDGGHWYFNNGTQFGDAENGARFLNFANDPNMAPISQSFAVTANTTYTVSYWLGRRADDGGSPDITTAAITLATGGASGTLSLATASMDESTPLHVISTGITPVTGWQQFSYNFTPNNDTVATLTFSSSGGSGYSCLDNVSVNSVPEPTAMAIAVTGLISLVAFAWRRRG
jgi:hypothetical protein